MWPSRNHSSALAGLFGQGGDLHAGVQDPGGEAASQRLVQQRPGGVAARVSASDGLGGVAVADGHLDDGLGVVGDELVLRDVEAVEHVQGGMFQADEAAAQGRGRRRGLVDDDVVKSGVQQQQRGDGAGDAAADDRDAGPAGGCHEGSLRQGWEPGHGRARVCASARVAGHRPGRASEKARHRRRAVDARVSRRGAAGGWTCARSGAGLRRLVREVRPSGGQRGRVRPWWGYRPGVVNGGGVGRIRRARCSTSSATGINGVASGEVVGVVRCQL